MDNMTKWNLNIPDSTDQTVRTYLVQNGGKEDDLSQFVNEAVCQSIFRKTVKDLKEKNASHDQEALMHLIDEAVDWTRANRS